jgi:DNA polymerase elongation subunit (family B)
MFPLFITEPAPLCLQPGKVPVEKFVIHKGLTKNPEEYPDKKSQPHVQVALRMKASGKSVRPLDSIPYATTKRKKNKGKEERVQEFE